MGPMLLLLEHGFKCYLLVRSRLQPVQRFLVRCRKKQCIGSIRLHVYDRLLEKAKMWFYSVLFSHGRGDFFTPFKICVIKEVGESFLGKNSSKCLVVLISSLWHFWQTRKREIKLSWRTIISCCSP